MLVMVFLEAMSESGISEDKRIEILRRAYKKIESLHETEGK